MAWASETAVGNVALSLLGAGTISDIDSTTDPRAKALSAFFDTARDHVLSLHDWAFADVVAQLTVDAVVSNTTPYDYAYDMPAAMIRMICLNAGSTEFTDMPYAPYLIRGSHIFCDYSPAWLRYTTQSGTVTNWPHWFGLAMATYLAYLAAPKLTENQQKQDKMERLFGGQIIESIRMDKVQRQHWTQPPTLITDVG